MIWAIGFLSIYLALMLLVVWISVYPFRTPIFFAPASFGLPQENVEFHTEDGIRLRGWWIDVPEPKAVAILSHGYMMNRSELAPLALLLAKEGCAALVYDHRAHGSSGGRKCGFGLREAADVRAAVQLARSRAPGAKVVLIGSSMGSVAGALATAQDPSLADALILDSAYSWLPNAIQGWWYLIGRRPMQILMSPSVLLAAPIAGFNPLKVDVAKAIRPLKQPILILHGERDTLAPPAEAKRNHAAVPANSRLVWFEGCQHSEARWLFADRYHAEVLDFLRDSGVLPGQSGQNDT